MRTPVVIDTNVLVTAEGGPQASRACAALCQKKLKDVQESGCVALDSHWEVLKEYERNLSTNRQPGIGYVFWKWLLNDKTVDGRCLLVEITNHQLRGYEEFPEHDGLKDFDPSDRKFVAIAAKQTPKLPILQATDSKWVGWKDALAECGIYVEFVCRTEIETKHKKKRKYGAK